MENNYDIAIIGIGPAGLEAVNIAIKNNLKVIAFEKNMVGGCCLNYGCIPTKSMLHFATFINEFDELNNCGFNLEKPTFKLSEILKYKEEIVTKFSSALEKNLSKKITLIKKEAFIKVEDDVAKIVSDNNEINAKNIIFAAGSIPKELKGLEFDHNFIINSDDIYNLKEIPKHILIIGSGAIGLENAYILSKLGAKVTIVEKEKNLAPQFDIDIQKRIERILKLQGIEFLKDDYIVSIDKQNKEATLNSNKKIKIDKILVAIGRSPIKSDLEAKNLFKIGDCNTKIMLAHAATAQAKNIMDKILFNKESINNIIPKVIYLNPEIASVGLNENDIENKNEYVIKKIMIGSNPKAWCDNSKEGFIKVILKDDIIKGFHIVSKNASDLISIVMFFIQNNIKKQDILNLVFPHPSLSESILEVLKNG